jgi:hypothetical protein
MGLPAKGGTVMANTQAYFGFRQYQGTGSAPTYEQIAVAVAYNASAIYFGDPVTPQTDGTVARSASTGATPGVPGIAGIFVGCQYLSVSQKRTVWSNYWPGSDVASGNTVIGYIINDPNAKFVAQSDATGIAAADVGSTIGFAIGSGNTSNGISGAYLDTTTINTATYNVYAPFKIVSVITDPPGSQGTLGNGQPYDYAVVAFNYVATKNFVGI